VQQRAKAAVLDSTRSIRLADFPIPEIDDLSGLLRIESSGVCGADWLPYTGETMGGMFTPPLILGHEIVGHIESIGGEAARRWGVNVGDRVIVEEPIPCGVCARCRSGRYHLCGNDRYGGTSITVAPALWGGYAEYLFLDPRAIVHKMPAAIPIDVAPLFVPISNGVSWVQEVGRAKIGSTVVIQGPGQHGLGCVIGAREAGAGTVIVTGVGATDRRRLEVARELGADHTICVDDEDAVARVRDITSGAMADVVIHAAEKAPRAFEMSVELAGIGATVVNVGTVLGPASEFSPDHILMKELTIRGVVGRYQDALKAAISLMALKKYPLELMATHTFSIDRVDEALRTVGREIGTDPIHVTVIAGS
jgi:threonine dehydrogenase-like Zn-dependent dehydrogenase